MYYSTYENKYKLIGLKMNRPLRILLLLYFVLIVTSGCSIAYKIERGEVSPQRFHETINFETIKGLMLIPCEHEGEIKNFVFDTGAQISNIQRSEIKGKKLNVRGASNRIVVNGSEVVKSLKINEIEFKKTFASNENMTGLKDQVQNFGGILGRPIIDRANWLIDNPNRTVVISNEELSDNTFKDIRLDATSDAPYTNILVDSLEYRSIIDLGSTSELNVPKGTELAKKLIATYDFNDNERERYTVGGIETIVEQVGVIPLLQIGDISFEQVNVTINESSKIRVGMNLFKNNTIYIDSTNKQYSVK